MNESSIEELKRAVAALFLGEGLESMSKERAISAISMKRRWFSPDNALRFLKNAEESGLIRMEGKKMVPLFEYADTELPFGYYPPESVLDFESKGLIDDIRSEWEIPEDEFGTALSSDYPFSDEVKLILWGIKRGKDASEFIKRALDDIAEGSSG